MKSEYSSFRRFEVEVRFLKGRLKFENPEHVKNTAPFPSMIVIYSNKRVST